MLQKLLNSLPQWLYREYIDPASMVDHCLAIRDECDVIADLGAADDMPIPAVTRLRSLEVNADKLAVDMELFSHRASSLPRLVQYQHSWLPIPVNELSLLERSAAIAAAIADLRAHIVRRKYPQESIKVADRLVLTSRALMQLLNPNSDDVRVLVLRTYLIRRVWFDIVGRSPHG